MWLFVAAVGLVSAAVWLFDLTGIRGGDVRLPWWGLVIAFYLAETLVVHLHFRKQAHTLSPSEVALVLGLFLGSPLGLLVGQLVGAGLALAIQRRQRPIKLAFNLAEQSLCTGLGLLVFHALSVSGSSRPFAWVAALLAAGAAHVTGLLLVSAVIAIADRRFSAPQLVRTLVVTTIGALAAACVGLTTVELWLHQPLALLLFVAPAAICGITLRSYMVQREHREHLEFLYESMRATQSAPELGLAVGQLLSAARKLLRAEHAEILLLTSTPDEPLLRSFSRGADEALMEIGDLTPEVEAAFAYMTESDHSLVLPRRRKPHQLDGFLASLGDEDALIGALRSEERVFGVLVVGGRVGDVSTFAKSDLRIFDTFAGHASILLENGRLEQSLTRLTELKEELRHQAYHDALTGLPNRSLFTDRVEAALESDGKATQHAVLFLDLDGFKVVNDSWGHAIGDELLIHVAERIRRIVRPDDTAARLGGDEFGILLEDIDADAAAATAERLASSLGKPFSIAGRQIRVHVSVGIALSRSGTATTQELLRNADTAMYTAKADDHRRFAFYEANLHSRLRRHRKLVLEIERAVDYGEIEVHYQPVVSLADDGLQAFEALARWRHPDRGLLPATEFMSLAEEAGVMRKLGATVREQAFEFARQWQDTYPDADPVGLWTNLSPRELVEEQLTEEIGAALARFGLDPGILTLEITESSVIRDEPGALRAMHRLRDLGLHLSLDDFGTGYSSLSRLAEFPIELLKVPKPFVDRLVGATPDTSFVDAILRLADSLGLVTVGEGVEFDAQAARLRSLGCRYGQGYLFGRPLRAEAALREAAPATAPVTVLRAV